MTRSFSAVVRVAVLTAAVCCLPVPAAAQSASDEAFREGWEARGDSKWADVIAHMKRAIAAESTESTRRVRVSGNILRRRDEEYLPHYYLGEALYRSGDCVGAIEQWEISEGQGAIRRVPDVLKDLQSGYRECERKGFLPPPEYATARKETRQAIDQAEATEKAVTSLTGKDALSRELTASLDGARKDLASARTRFSSGERGRLKSDFAEAKAGAERARATLLSIESSLNALAKDLTNRIVQQAANVEKTIAAARETDRAIDSSVTATVQLTTEMRATRQASLEHLDTATGQLETGKRAQNLAALTEASTHATEATRGLSQVLADVKRLVTEAADRAAAEAFQRALERALALGKQAFSFADASLARLVERLQKRPDGATAEVTAQRDELEKRINDLRPRLDREGEGKNLVGVQALTRSANNVRARLDKLIESFGPVTIEEQVGTVLYTAAQSFINGDYAATIATLDTSSASIGPMQVHAHLFKAASLFALYVRSGEKDQTLLNRANEEIGRGRGLDPGLQPDPRMFSPRFIAAYESGGFRPAPAPAPASAP